MLEFYHPRGNVNTVEGGSFIVAQTSAVSAYVGCDYDCCLVMLKKFICFMLDFVPGWIVVVEEKE